MITPITRKELYLAKIIGEDVDIPETAKTREELFFLKILDNFSKIPEPITREELFLAKISGQNVELPEPKTRLELFLAKAAGVEIETPTPITREEVFWADYALIVEKEISGSPPLTFTGQNTEVLKNYRIYGNTVNGNSVGDKTANLCDEIYIPGNVLGSSSQRLKIEHTIPVTAGTAYTLSFVSSDFQLYIDSSPTAGYPFSGSTLTYCGNPSGWQSSDCTFTATNNGYIALTIRKKNNAVISADDIDFPVMFQVGAQASAYEPYGYRIPVTLNDLTAIIYLSEPLGKTGNNADYLDFTAQKRYNADGTSGDILLPPLTISAGTNTLTVGTEVQPSSVEIKGRIQEVTP